MDLSKAERLAALLDGTCSDREREELLAQLAAGGDDLEVFADAAALLHEPEEAEVDADVIPLRPAPKPVARPRWKPPRWVGLAAAAGLAALVVLPLLWRKGGAETPREIVAELSNPRSGLPAGLEMEPWGASRGAAGAALSDGERVQLGARLADLELLSGRNDSAAREAAGDVARLLGSGPSDLPARYDRMSVAGVPPGGPDPELGRRALALGGEYARLGAWIETARFAAASGDEAFFRSRPSRAVLAGRGPAKVLPRPRAAGLRRVEEALAASPPRWEAVRTELDALLLLLAR